MLGVCAGALGVLWVGAVASRDHDRGHEATTRALPALTPALAIGPEPKLVTIEAGGFTFRARAAGFTGARGNVVLLHGFPETSIMYEDTLRALAVEDYRVLAFDQRGYSPGARPEGKDAYQAQALMQDVLDVADAVGFERFHLVGHDWGAAIGWQLVMADQGERVRSWTALSIPHITAYGEALATDTDQQERSAYVGFFRLPWLPETLFSFNGLTLMEDSLYAEHPPAEKAEYLKVFAEPGALTAALNWYRAVALDTAPSVDPIVTLPVLFVWGADDPVVGAATLERQRAYLKGPYRELELPTGHWLLQTEGEVVNAAIARHLAEAVAAR